MEEILKMLNISEINYLYLDYTDKHGNFKTLKLDYRQEARDSNKSDS